MDEQQLEEMKEILYGEFELQIEKEYAMKDFINNILKNSKPINFQSFVDFYGTGYNNKDRYKERDLKIQNDRLQKEIDNNEREREDRIYNREGIKDRDR